MIARAASGDLNIKNLLKDIVSNKGREKPIVKQNIRITSFWADTLVDKKVTSHIVKQSKTEKASALRNIIEKERRNKLINKSTQWNDFRQKKNSVTAAYVNSKRKIHYVTKMIVLMKIHRILRQYYLNCTKQMEIYGT